MGAGTIIRETFLTQYNNGDGVPVAFVHWNGENWRAMEVRPGQVARLIVESKKRKHADDDAERFVDGLRG